MEKKIFNLNWIYLLKIFVTMYYIRYTRGAVQSNYIEVAHLYGRENEIWAGFGPVGNKEKKI